MKFNFRKFAVTLAVTMAITSVCTYGTEKLGITPYIQAKAAETSNTTITNDTFYKDIEGNPIYSQGGGIFKFGERYYWYGVKYAEAPAYCEKPEGGKINTSSFSSVTCYSSMDLVNWKFEKEVLTTETPGINSGWVGRLGVVYNKNSNKYVLICQGNGGIIFATCDTPTGDFVFDHTLSKMPYFTNGGTGDQTLFQDDDGKAYIICSSVSGRSHEYIAPLRESDFLDIDGDRVKEIYYDSKREFAQEDGSIGVKDKGGIEGNCMFKYKGHYYFTGSDLYGWNSSHTYVLEADNIFGPYNIQHEAEDVNLPYVMQGCSDSYSHCSQTGFYVTVKGSKQDTVIFCGDRWSDFAGNGIGYNQWVPLSFDGYKPIFNDLHQWNFNAKEGTWKIGKENNFIHNSDFEADRIKVNKPIGWTVSDNIGGTANCNLSGKQYAGNFVWQQIASTDYTAALNQTIKNLPNGVYTLKAWVKSSGGQNICNIYAKDYDGSEADYQVNTPIEEWTEVTVSDNIIVNNGQCEIGLYSDSAADNWVQIDNLSLTKNDGK